MNSKQKASVALIEGCEQVESISELLDIFAHDINFTSRMIERIDKMLEDNQLFGSVNIEEEEIEGSPEFLAEETLAHLISLQCGLILSMEMSLRAFMQKAQKEGRHQAAVEVIGKLIIRGDSPSAN
jgi:hypothetical protein